MAKRNKKNDPQQKNKQGFDSAILSAEFAHEMGSAKVNNLHKEKAKKARASQTNNNH